MGFPDGLSQVSFANGGQLTDIVRYSHVRPVRPDRGAIRILFALTSVGGVGEFFEHAFGTITHDENVAPDPINVLLKLQAGEDGERFLRRARVLSACIWSN